MAMSTVNRRHNLSTSPSSRDYAAMASVKQINDALAPPHHRHMWIITGPAGCGKSTIAQYLAKELSIPYIEGDDVSGSRVSMAAVLPSWLTKPPKNSTIPTPTNKKCPKTNL